jgi:Rod binding domain-containing protein
MSDIRTLTAASPGPNREQLMNLSRDAGKVKESASQFEALLMGQMLRSARESGGSWFGGGEDEAASSAIGMAEEHLAQTIAAQGGLGLSGIIEQGLANDRVRAKKAP